MDFPTRLFKRGIINNIIYFVDILVDNLIDSLDDFAD